MCGGRDRWGTEVMVCVVVGASSGDGVCGGRDRWGIEVMVCVVVGIGGG